VEPQEEKSFTPHHGKDNAFSVSEEYLGEKQA
jgi:hypothetical protein